MHGHLQLCFVCITFTRRVCVIASCNILITSSNHVLIVPENAGVIIVDDCTWLVRMLRCSRHLTHGVAKTWCASGFVAFVSGLLLARRTCSMSHTFDCFLQVEAHESAYSADTEVQHPLLDKVRQCSANPDQAASFFLCILNPVPYMRVEAVSHAWIGRTVNKMFDEMDFDYSVLSPAADADRQSRAKQRYKSGGYTSWFACCGGASPTLEADSHAATDCFPSMPKTQNNKSLKSLLTSKLRRGKRFRDAAAGAGRSDDSEVVNPQADSPQRAERTTIEKGWDKVKGAFIGRSRRGTQQADKDPPQTTAGVSDSRSGALEAFQSAKSSNAVNQRKVHVRAVSSNAGGQALPSRLRCRKCSSNSLPLVIMTQV